MPSTLVLPISPSSRLLRVDINSLTTYQQVSLPTRLVPNSLAKDVQVVFYFMTMIATPIFIHTFVVFIRLYWFERRFQHIAREARNLRHTRTRSRTKTEAKDQPDLEKEGQGVRGRSIVVLHKQEGADSIEDGSTTPNSKKLEDSEPTSASSSSHGEKPASKSPEGEAPLDQLPSLHREVTFADEINEMGGGLKSPTQRLPLRQSAEEHIAFREKQRNPQSKSTLRIPGPRDFDRGHAPETVVEDEDGGALGQKVTSPIEDAMNTSAGLVRRNITIDGTKRPRQRAGTGLSKISTPSQRTNHVAHAKTTSPDRENEDEGNLPHPTRLKARTSTFESLRHWGSREPEPVTPYLSWQPTVGRNSAFVDLTEEQREELGGIEYRSLKTLAIVLVCTSFSCTLKEDVLTTLGSVLRFVPYIGFGCIDAVDSRD